MMDDDDVPPPKRRKGGQKQRLQQLAREETPATSSTADSGLAQFLEEAWAWGDLTPQQVQRIAALTKKDMLAAGLTESDVPGRLKKLAEIGTAGAHSNNCHRDLMAYLPGKCKLPRPFQEVLPFKTGQSAQAFMLPHEVFSALYHHYPGYWQASFLPGGVPALQAFWKHFDKHPCMADGTLADKDDFRKTCLPLALHGDAVPTTGLGKVWAKLLQTFNWHCMLCRGGSKATLFLVWSVFEQLLVAGDNGTLETFFRILKWSFTALYHGKFPEGSVPARKAGDWLANGFCGVLVCLQGDLEFFAKSLSLPRWSSNENCCPLCPATGSGAAMNWRNFRETAPWVGLCWRPASWRAFPERSKCPLFDIPAVSGATVAVDYMHSKYLGSDMYVYGGLFYYMCFYLMTDTPQANLLTIWSELQELYRLLGVKHRYAYFNRLTMFVRKSGPPKLRGRAAEVKGLALPMLHLWEKYMNGQLQLHRMILAMLKTNCTMELLLDEYRDEDFFPQAAANQFKAAAFQMAHLHGLVADHFHEQEDCPWLCHTTAKLHMVLHSALLAGTVNPRLVWCFANEDFMGITRKVAQNCVRGTK
ncbi:unnamed protein product, partial [Symbiodinium sp. CCMP2592]